MRVFNISGGRTSAYMTIKYYQKGDLVIFCDTQREHKGTYEFLDNIELFENIPIIRLTYDGGWDSLLDKRKAIPNYFKRFCTMELKVKTTRRYLRTQKILTYDSYIGFRYDELDRYKKKKKMWKKVTDVFPLVTDKITNKDIIKYWQNKEYDLNIPAILGNCDACFMKGENAILTIYQQFPELAEKWIADEKRIGNTYLNGVSHQQMLNKSKLLMKQYSLFEIEPKYKCGCIN
jgi:3'-phosphoadenosine 5'-phosphosulfate sulfotransferase (PAPS reductase)/FAD synthetase